MSEAERLAEYVEEIRKRWKDDTRHPMYRYHKAQTDIDRLLWVITRLGLFFLPTNQSEEIEGL